MRINTLNKIITNWFERFWYSPWSFIILFNSITNTYINYNYIGVNTPVSIVYIVYQVYVICIKDHVIISYVLSNIYCFVLISLILLMTQVSTSIQINRNDKFDCYTNIDMGTEFLSQNHLLYKYWYDGRNIVSNSLTYYYQLNQSFLSKQKKVIKICSFHWCIQRCKVWINTPRACSVFFWNITWK